MVCLRSKLSLKNTVSAADVWHVICEWRRHSKNTPAIFKTRLINLSFAELPLGINEVPHVNHSNVNYKISVLKCSDSAFAFKLVENAVVTTICFDSAQPGSNFTLEIERNDAAVAKVSRPKIFDLLEPLLADGSYSKTAREIGDYSAVAQFINGAETDLPFVYVSKNKHNEYLTNPDTLAASLFGIAHVVKEPNTAFSKQLHELTNGKNAYNGAVGIYYGKTRIFVLPENATDFDYFYRIIRLSVLIQFNPLLTWHGMITPFFEQATKEIQQKVFEIQIQSKALQTAAVLASLKNVFAESELKKQIAENSELKSKFDELETSLHTKDELIEQLQAELCAVKNENANIKDELRKKELENKAFIETFDSEHSELQNQIASQQTIIEKLQSYAEAFKKQEPKDINIAIACAEKPLYPGEFEDFFKGLIFTVAKRADSFNGGTQKDEKGFVRMYHVLKSIYEKNPDFAFENSETAKRISNLKRATVENDKECVALLQSVGYEMQSDNNHRELFLHGDGRYSVTVSRTGSDKRSSKNCLSIAEHHFLTPEIVMK